MEGGSRKEGLGDHLLCNSVVDEFHPQLSHNRLPMDGALVGAGSHNSRKGCPGQVRLSQFILVFIL
jgi:hypothetical protein